MKTPDNWEVLSTTGGATTASPTITTERLSVPRGWLYRTIVVQTGVGSGGAVAVHQTFVADIP